MKKAIAKLLDAEPKHRPIAVMQQEYANLCAKAGELNLRIENGRKELADKHVEINALHRELMLAQAEDAARKLRESAKKEKNEKAEVQPNA